MFPEGSPAEMIFHVVGLKVLTAVVFSGMCNVAGWQVVLKVWENLLSPAVGVQDGLTDDKDVVFRNFRRRFAGVLRCLVTDRGAGSGVQESAPGPAADFDIIFFFCIQ